MSYPYIARPVTVDTEPHKAILKDADGDHILELPWREVDILERIAHAINTAPYPTSKEDVGAFGADTLDSIGWYATWPGVLVRLAWEQHNADKHPAYWDACECLPCMLAKHVEAEALKAVKRQPT